MNSEIVLSARIENIIAKQEPQKDILRQTEEFVREVLAPCPERYDMTYRYEHSLRVASWGQKIAREESLPEIPLMMACLLHDAGYPECKTMEDWNRHPAFSEIVARKYLEKIHYDESLTESICRGVLYHDRWNNFPEDLSSFELSVRDADDLDRFDVMRLCLLGHGDIGEHSAEKISENCRKRLQWEENARNRICGTETARRFWMERMDMYRNFYRELLRQMENTREI